MAFAHHVISLPSRKKMTKTEQWSYGEQSGQMVPLGELARGGFGYTAPPSKLTGSKLWVRGIQWQLLQSRTNTVDNPGITAFKARANTSRDVTASWMERVIRPLKRMATT